MAAPKKALKKNPELDALLREVQGHPSDDPKVQAKTGGSIKVEPAPTRTKALTPVLKKSLKDLIKQRLHLSEKIEEMKKDLAAKNLKLTDMVNKYGRKLLDAPKDRVVFTNPFKAHLVWNDRAGAIDAEEVGKVFPELIEVGSEKVDLQKIADVIETFDVKPEAKKILLDFRRLVIQLEKSTSRELIDKEGEGLLNMEKYKELRDSGKFTSAQLEKFETTEGHYSLRVDELSDAPRCSCCGHKRPKRVVADKHYACTRCGHSE